MGAAAIFVFVLAITAQSIYTHVGLSREGIIEQDKNPEHTSNIGVDINKENSAKESLVSNSHLYHGSSIFGFGHNKKVKQQSEVEVKFYKESHSAKHCSVSCYCGPNSCGCSCNGDCCNRGGCCHTCSCCCHGRVNYTDIADEDLIGLQIKF